METLSLKKVLYHEAPVAADQPYPWTFRPPQLRQPFPAMRAEDICKDEVVFVEAPALKAAVPWDGHYDPLANTLERHSRDRFISSDKAYFEKTGKHLDINEGSTDEGNARRSCRRQAQLWMNYNVFHFPNASKAHAPGCSHHNYGMAVDLKVYNTTIRDILVEYGWTDEYPGERWHFTCKASDIFDTVEKTIAGLQSGIADQWRKDTVIAFQLNRDKNTLYDSLKQRQAKFEGDVKAFNLQAKRFNEAKELFGRQTDPYATRRDDLFLRLRVIDEQTRELEQAFAFFREVADEVITTVEQNLEEIRRLLALPAESLPSVLDAKLPRVPAALQAKYRQALTRFIQLKTALDANIRALETLTTTYNSSIGDFEKRALELLKEYEFLKSLRQSLEAEKNALERGFVDVQLMSQEAMFRLRRSSETLEQIQAIVDAVSPS